MIRIFFPGLLDQGTARSGSFLSKEELRDLYDKGVRPAVEAVAPASLHDWPADFFAESFRAKKHQHGFSQSSKPLPGYLAEEFSRELRSRLAEDVPWAKNIVFGTQIRGVKNATCHDLHESRPALQRFLENIDTTRGHWYIDVALEFVDKGRALLWRSDAHHHIAAEALALRPEEAESFTTNSKHRVDLSSHLTALAGFQSSPTKSQGGPYQITYLQAYTTDKSVTYHPEKGHFGKFITPSMAMTGAPPTFCENLEQAYKSARDKVDVAARIEVRVELKYANHVLLSFDHAVLHRSLVSMKRGVWWYVQGPRARFSFQIVD
jgi:hypothetical protein